MRTRKRNTRTMNFAALPLDQLKCVAEIVVAAIDLRMSDRADDLSKGVDAILGKDDILDDILARARRSVKLQRVLFERVDALNALLLAAEETERATRAVKQRRRARARSRKK